jgi:hypothetical protein
MAKAAFDDAANGRRKVVLSVISLAENRVPHRERPPARIR